mmetsp:Transcript_39529/g.84251  ORF Transcript_39529/g.84251 Transcript_39529/m.84251 type:complete len:222 (-) Transcript_39529:2143-2808(-)
MSFAGVSNAATSPCFKTRMRSQLSTKRRRWAMHSTVESLPWDFTTSMRRSADSWSKEAAHSSRIITLGRRTRARAAMSSCNFPTVACPSAMGALSVSATGTFSNCVSCRASRPQFSRSAKTLASENSSPMLNFRLPAKSVGSWGTIATAARRSLSFNVAISTPAMVTVPPLLGSTPLRGPKRNNKLTRVDLPLPVFPTTPSFSLAFTVKLTLDNAAVPCGT